MQSRILGKNNSNELKAVERLFGLLYQDLGAKGQHYGLKEGGEQVWMNSLVNGLGRFSCIIVVESDKKIIGFVQGGIRLGPEYLQTHKNGFLAHQYILPDYRRKGLGKLLFNKLEKWFREKQVDLIELQTNFLNEEGKGFYQSMGFSPDLLQLSKAL